MPERNLLTDESVHLWKGRLGLKQYVPLKAAQSRKESYELCESKSGYL